MGLNFERIAQMKLAAAAAETAQPQVKTVSAALPAASANTKSSVLSSLAGLDALSSTSTAVSAQQSESAGTINFNQVSAQIVELNAAIKAAHPQLPVLLQEVWNTLNKYPECVTLLKEDEMEVIVSGLEKQTSTDLAAITLKNATKGGKKAPVTAALLGF